jgi:hypothetical protein
MRSKTPRTDRLDKRIPERRHHETQAAIDLAREIEADNAKLREAARRLRKRIATALDGWDDEVKA